MAVSRMKGERPSVTILAALSAAITYGLIGYELYVSDLSIPECIPVILFMFGPIPVYLTLRGLLRGRHMLAELPYAATILCAVHGVFHLQLYVLGPPMDSLPLREIPLALAAAYLAAAALITKKLKIV